MKQGRRNRRSGWWITAGTLAAYVVGGGKAKAVAATVPAAGTEDAGPQAQISVRRFNIAAGPLDQALEEYCQITGIKLHTESLGTGLAGIHSHGVRGMYSDEAALRELLAGTGLASHFDDAVTVTIAIRNAEHVDVNGGPNSTVALSKFTQPLVDTPQSVSVVPEYVMQEQGISTLRDTLRNVPGISLAAGESGAQGDNLTIRGFTARNDIFLDGIRDYGSYYRDSFNYAQVDVLEGPAGVQFGRGSTGGVINQESKQPLMEDALQVQAQAGTDATMRATALPSA